MDDLLNVFEGHFSRQDHDIGKLGKEADTCRVTDICLDRDVYGESNAMSVADDGKVGGNNGVNTRGESCVAEGFCCSDFIIVDESVKCEVGFCT